MDQETARTRFRAGDLKEVIIEPADQGNGWMIVIRPCLGEPVKLTDHGGGEKVYHSLEHATEVARGIGFDTVRVEERF
ncbi:MAG: hypothetical protein PVF91_02810 [Chromatiales bacterium]|jgi:hypothetical protein